MKNTEVIRFIRHWLMLLGAACVWFLWDSRFTRNLWFMAVAWGLFLCVVLFFLTWVMKPKFLASLPAPKNEHQTWLIFLAAVIGLIALFFNLKLYLFAFAGGRFILAVGVSGVFALLLSGGGRSGSPYLEFGKCMLLLGAAYRTAAFITEAQSGPFALGWSEGSRFYNASLFVSEQLYGVKLPLPVLHPSRYLMQALPLFVGARSILLHRVWQVILWLGMTFCGSWLLAKRINQNLKGSMAWLTALLMLFFFQGAVYYHLMVCVVLVLGGYKKDQPLWTLAFVLLGSAWAGISRVNWMPVPGILAAALYLLDTVFDGKSWFKYLWWPVLWVIAGLAAAYLTKQAYISLSGENPALFDSAFSSALLWQRLWPNATFFLGIIPAVLLVMLPGFALVWLRSRQKSLPSLHWLQWLGLAGILAVFFAGGLVVSVKIGGGGDLHNMDGFLVFWAVIVGDIFAKSGGAKLSEADGWKGSLRFWMAMAGIVPVFFAFMRTGSWSFGGAKAQAEEMSELKRAIAVLQQSQGEVLLISERQLLTFGELNLPIVPEYEKVFLMEMAMADNQEYLSVFRQKLADHAFSAILSDSLSANIQGSNRGFAEENNAWVRQVVLPMLEEYEGVLSWRNGEVNLLVPIGEPELKQQLLDSQLPPN